MSQQPIVLVLASGRGARFFASGGTVYKLHAPLAGKTVLQRTLDAVRASGLPWHVEDQGHPGMGDSIAAAVRATSDAPGWLMLPADLPLVQASSLLQVAQTLKTHSIAVACHHGQRGHPVGFAAVCRTDLLALVGQAGASAIVRAYDARGEMACVELPDDAGVVQDIDTLDDLARVEQFLQAGTQP